MGGSTVWCFIKDPWNFNLYPCHHYAGVNRGGAGEFKSPFQKDVGFQLNLQDSLQMTWEI